ncbi:nose resistant to fluoxetine protein 6 [Neodiprion lecontei]|uniref:Nose resistant to fluoxetine protein 6 n=1 Tax=Neodiprion lecontei TaxID=441921 RepID=A0A6J0BAB8_NEOLC|nr:nose resistant to fluoxetine protein 6 [Neodiprion lecontei]
MLSFRAGCAAVLLFACTQSLASASLKDDGNNTMDIMEFIEQFGTPLKTRWMAMIPSIVNSSDTSCKDEFTALIQAFQSTEEWAFEILDASSKIQSGIMTGNIRDLGMYDECLQASGHYDNISVRGKYCTVRIRQRSNAIRAAKTDINVGIISSICAPSSCSDFQIEELVKSFLGNTSENSYIGIEIEGVNCVQPTSEDFTTGEILTIILLTAIAQFVIFCTICDFLKRRGYGGSSTLIDTLSKFSLYINGRALLSTEVKPQMMPSIPGIRFLGMCWIVLGHRYVSTLLNPTINIKDIFVWMDLWSSVHVQIAVFVVDTFFVISGFLLAYTFLKSMKSGKKFNLAMMYFHRFVRLTPSVMVLVLFCAFLLHRIANGPIWNMMNYLVITPCQRNWWLNLLYVQNFVDKENICLLHTWYLAVDMQLFWISPVIVYPLYRWPKVGLGILGSFLVISIVTPAVILGVNRYSNGILEFTESVISMDYFYNYYILTYNRAFAYFVGIMLGYDVVTKKRKLTKVVNVSICWAISCIFVLFCGCATHVSYNSNYPYSVAREVVFAIFMRPFWSIATAWLIYACTQGYGGFLSSFLSLPIFLPLGRLTYNIYLVHMLIQWVKSFSTRVPGVFSDLRVFNEFCGDMVVSIAFAFILSVFIESPVIVLEKILMKNNQKSEQSSTLPQMSDNNGKAKEEDTMLNMTAA